MIVDRDVVVSHDTPERAPGIRPVLTSRLVQIANPNDGGYVTIAVNDDGSLAIVIHRGSVRVEDKRGA